MDIKPIIKEDFITLGEDTTVSEMIGKLKAYEKRTALIFRKSKYIGMIEKKRLLKTRVDSNTTKIKYLVQNTPVIKENSDLIDIAYLMYQSDIDYLPVERAKKIAGTLYALDLLALSTQMEEMKKVKVKDIKLIKPSKLQKDSPIANAIKIMHNERIEQVPILEENKIYGIISFRDFIRKYLNWTPARQFSTKFNKEASSKGVKVDMPHLASLPVSDFSTNQNLLTTSLSTDLNLAIGLMVKNNVSDLIVMDEEDYLGILTIKNILRKIASFKVKKEYNIRFVGLNSAKLQGYQKEEIKEITASEAAKLQRKIKNNINLTVHIKEYDKGGAERKYNVHLHIQHPGKTITLTQDDWNPITALHKTFENAHNAIKNKNHNGISREKYY